MCKFRKQLKGFPKPLQIKRRLGCAWSVHIEDISGELVLKEGWYDFALEHELELDYVLVFKVIDNSSMKVKIYENNMSTQRVIFVLITLSCILHA
jgi:hypothetical protein